MRIHPHKGFTLLELLVVFGIIICLVGILLPALVGAREQSKRVQCLSNIRSLTAAWLAYASDNEGHICSAAPGRSWSWIGLAAGMKGLESGVLWHYLNTPEVYRCPDEQTPRFDARTGLDHIVANSTSYVMSGLLAGGVGDPYPRTKLNELSQPAKTFVFIEGCSLLPLNQMTFPTPIYPANVFAGGNLGGSWPGENHLDGNVVAGTSISFADGHAIFWKYSDWRTGNLRVAESTGILNTTLPHGNSTITRMTGGDTNSSDLYQLEAWSGGQVPPGVVQ